MQLIFDILIQTKMFPDSSRSQLLDSRRCRPLTLDIREEFCKKVRRMLLECGTSDVASA